jgi:hypothetical protein
MACIVVHKLVDSLAQIFTSIRLSGHLWHLQVNIDWTAIAEIKKFADTMADLATRKSRH